MSSVEFHPKRQLRVGAGAKGRTCVCKRHHPNHFLVFCGIFDVWCKRARFHIILIVACASGAHKHPLHIVQRQHQVIA